MRDRLPVHIEDRDLPMDEFSKRTEDDNNSYGYVNVLFLATIITTIASLVTIIILRKW